MFKFYILGYSLFLFFLVSCHKPSDKAVSEPGYEYFPIIIGNSQIYEVNQKIIQPTETIEKIYQVKELISDSYFEGDEEVYVLEKYYRPDSNALWPDTPDSVQTVRISDNRAILTESNQRIIKLIFPVSEGRGWDANAMNTASEDLYFIKQLGQSFEYEGQVFANTLTVDQENDTTNLIKRDVRYEVYSKNTGLVYKFSSVLSLNFVSGDTTEGEILTKKLWFDSN